ncbi:MAG: hypothetical protein ACXQTV_02350 [Candidatus Hecatellaceae archaeon]
MAFPGALETAITTIIAAILALAIIIILAFERVSKRRKVEAGRLEKILAEIRREAEKLRLQLSKLDEFQSNLASQVLQEVKASRYGEALEKLKGFSGLEELPRLRCELEAYMAELQALNALNAACMDAVKIWVIEAVRVNLPQTAKRWRDGSHGYNPHLDELLAFTLSEAAVKAESQSLYEWFKLNSPGQYEALTKLLDPSESLEVFFRMLEKTLSELAYLKTFREKHEEACGASRLKAALEFERQRILDQLEKLGVKLLTQT